MTASSPLTSLPSDRDPAPAAGAVLQGVPVVAGIQYGPVIRPGRLPEIDDADMAPEVAEEERPAEAARFTTAANTVATRLRDRAAHATGAASEVLAATATLAQDRAWLGAAEKLINAGAPAARAVVAAVDQFVDLFTQLGGLMAERVTDLRDIRDRVIAELSGLPEPGVPLPDVPSVLLAEDLAPADTAGLDPSLVIALATTLGGPTSHTAIIARQLGLPCVVAVDGLDAVGTGAMVLVDGTRGTVTVAPDPAVAADAVAAAKREAELAAGWTGPGATSDGHAVAVLANVQDGAAARSARETPAEGVGLFRTELCFLNRDTEPTVDEQAQIYGEVLEAFSGHKVVVRTLDAGSDKPLKFAGHPEEANPALGVRGIRIAQGNPGLLERQLDAIAAAAESTGNAPWVMAPMIATADEAEHFAAQVRSRGLTPGVMIEVPSAALLADRILGPRRLPVDRHQRSRPVHDGRRPDVGRSGHADRSVAARGPRTGRDGGPGGRGRWQAGRRMRRSGGRPAAGVRADRPRRDVTVRGGSGGDRRRRQAVAGDTAAVPRRGRCGACHGKCGRRARRSHRRARVRN